MLNSLDLLIIVFLALAGASLLALLLMFLLRNNTAKRVCMYVVAVLAVYLGTVGFRINWLDFPFQAALAVLMALVAVAAVVLDRANKDNEKMLRISRMMAAAALIVGMANAFMI